MNLSASSECMLQPHNRLRKNEGQTHRKTSPKRVQFGENVQRLGSYQVKRSTSVPTLESEDVANEVANLRRHSEGLTKLTTNRASTKLFRGSVNFDEKSMASIRSTTEVSRYNKKNKTLNPRNSYKLDALENDDSLNTGTFDVRSRQKQANLHPKSKLVARPPTNLRATWSGEAALSSSSVSRENSTQFIELGIKSKRDSTQLPVLPPQRRSLKGKMPTPLAVPDPQSSPSSTSSVSPQKTPILNKFVAALSPPSSKPMMMSPSSSAQVTMSPHPPDSATPKVSHWKTLRNAVNTSAKFQCAGESEESAARRRLERRNSYTVETDGVGSLKVVKLDKGTMRVADVQSLKSYFDEVDLNGDGTVTMEEVRLHRQNLKLRDATRLDEERMAGAGASGVRADRRRVQKHEDAIILMLLSIDEEFAFEDLLLKVYPHLSKRDIEACCKAIKLHKVSDEKTIHDSTVMLELHQCNEFWNLYADVPRGVMEIHQFETLLHNMLGKEVAEQTNYHEIAHAGSQKIHRKEFTLWWMRLYKDELLEWSDIQDAADEIWEELDYS